MAFEAPDTARAGLGSLCPRCGASGLFSGLTSFSAGCAVCALDFDQFNVGDGPAAFLVMIVGGVVTLLAVVVQLKFDPPFWVHILLWIPLTAALVIFFLRIAKGALLSLEYRNSAREGRLVE
jgi:uncharacterized protein (DUF983 family)